MRNISKEQVLERIRTENPWWNPPHEIPQRFSQLNPRPYLDLLHPLIETRAVRRAVVLMGPRQVGKTVMLHHAIQRLLAQKEIPTSIGYISVDHPIYNGCALEELLGVFETATGTAYKTQSCVIFFDEIQYLRNWEVHLKQLVDAYPNAKFIVSGSSAAALRLRSSESGAGRFTGFLLPPLTFHEYLELSHQGDLVTITKEDDEEPLFQSQKIDVLNQQFFQYLNFGGYPEVVLNPVIQRDPGRYIKSDIIDKVLLRDLPSLYGIQDIQELNYLFTTLAFNTANEESLDQLSTGSGVAKNTIKRYMEYLEAAFLIRIVHRVDRRGRRFKRANFFKVYLTNPSMRSALFSTMGINDPEAGFLVETGIFAQWFHAEDTKPRYARWQKGEVDIVGLGRDEKVRWAVEVKWSDRFYQHPTELRALLNFCHSHNLPKARVTTCTRFGEQTVENVTLEFQPASLYCFLLGYNIVHGKKIVSPS